MLIFLQWSVWLWALAETRLVHKQTHTMVLLQGVQHKTQHQLQIHHSQPHEGECLIRFTIVNIMKVSVLSDSLYSTSWRWVSYQTHHSQHHEGECLIRFTIVNIMKVSVLSDSLYSTSWRWVSYQIYHSRPHEGECLIRFTIFDLMKVSVLSDLP